jgi:NADPH:quinone reductase-like Zn-dependent oxidoreductase
MSRTIKFARAGGPEVLEFFEMEVPAPGQHEVRIKVKAIGINRADSMWRNDKYVESPIFPAGLGYDCAGVVDAVGKDVTDFAVGDTVSTISAFSLNKYFTYGEVILAPDYAVVKHPESLSFVEAASVWMMFIAAYGALVVDARVKAGDFVIVPATSSSVGLAAIQIANHAGATPSAMTRTSDKKKRLHEVGAAHVVATQEQDMVAELMRITNGNGARVAFDPVGGADFPKLVAALTDQGIAYVYGALSEDDTPIPLLGMIRKMATVKGTASGWSSATRLAGKPRWSTLPRVLRAALSSPSSITYSNSTIWWKYTAIWRTAANSARSSLRFERPRTEHRDRQFGHRRPPLGGARRRSLGHFCDGHGQLDRQRRDSGH